MKFTTRIITSALIVAGVASSIFVTSAMAHGNNQDKFFDSVKALCGKAFSGGIVEDTANSAAYSGRKFILHIRDCSDSQIKMPLHIGDNSSRILVLSKGNDSIKLEHDHRHADGSSDDLTLYGGYAMSSKTVNSASNQAFRESAESIEITKTFGNGRTYPSVWSIILSSDDITYQVVRPGRIIRTQFKLSNLVANPPKAWDLQPSAHD